MFVNTPFQNRLMLLNLLCHFFGQKPQQEQNDKSV